MRAPPASGTLRNFTLTRFYRSYGTSSTRSLGTPASPTRSRITAASQSISDRPIKATADFVRRPLRAQGALPRSRPRTCPVLDVFEPTCIWCLESLDSLQLLPPLR